MLLACDMIHGAEGVVWSGAELLLGDKQPATTARKKEDDAKVEKARMQRTEGGNKELENKTSKVPRQTVVSSSEVE